MDSGLHAGVLLDGKYKILRPIGRGGMGSVYEGENVRIGRRVAIKVLHSTIALERRFVERFEREAQAVARIGSHHVADVLDLGELPAGDRYMVMEYLQGETLAERVKDKGALPSSEVLHIITQLLDGLATMHAAGIIHRDLKPGNIFLTKVDSRDFVKILDFGIAKFSSANDIQWTTIGSTILGTPGYLSPEQLMQEDVGAEADLYAAGVLLYRCLAGRLPYDATTNSELLLQIRDGVRVPIEQNVPAIDRALAAIVMKGIAPELEDRFPSAVEFRAVLKAWAETAGPEPKAARVSVAPPPASGKAARPNENDSMAFEPTEPVQRPDPNARLAPRAPPAEPSPAASPRPLPPAVAAEADPATIMDQPAIDIEELERLVAEEAAATAKAAAQPVDLAHLAPHSSRGSALESVPPLGSVPPPGRAPGRAAPSKLIAIVIGAIIGVAAVVAYVALRAG